MNSTTTTVVQYGDVANTLSTNATGSSTRFGRTDNIQYIHRVTLSNLKPNTEYRYRCGSDQGWSSEFSFRTNHSDENWSPRLAVFGDMGVSNAKSLPGLMKDSANGLFDAILHVGDMGYNMDDYNGKWGNRFMASIQNISAHLPYMVVPGNHESGGNFTEYRKRFSMPGHFESLFYSFDMGPAHFIGLSTEVYYNSVQRNLIAQQLEWLKGDLKKAQENRVKRPWIITYGHRPMYCSTKDGDDCTRRTSKIRRELEDLFYDNGVDLEIWAHEHVYERLWPVYNHTVFNGSVEYPYTNPKAPVHILPGSAGCPEDTDPFIDEPAAWSAFRSRDYGYTRLHVVNKTHLHAEQVSDNKKGQVIDSFWLIKDKHGKYDEVL